MPNPAHAQHQPAAQRHERHGFVRAFAGAPTSVDEATRSSDIVITTERWDVDDESGLVIGSTEAVDASGCIVATNIPFTPPA